MAYTSPRVWTVGEGLTAAKLQAVSDNITYLKSQTDLLYLTVYNNDAVTLSGGDPVSFDPSYTSGLGVVGSVVAGDQRCIGTVKAGTTISSHSTGLVLAPGFVIQAVNVTGVVAFGHTLVASASIHYAQDAGGSGQTPGMIGWALATNGGGTASINALIPRSNPQYFSLATSLGNTFTNTSESTSSGTTQTIASVVSNGSNRLLLLWESMTIGASAFIFNSQNFTLFQGGGTPSLPFAWIIPNAFTGDITGTHAAVRSGGVSAALLLNGVNQSTPTRTYAAANGVGTAVSVVVPSMPGDMVFAGFTTGPVGYSISGRATGQGNLIDIQGGIPARLVIDSMIATGINTTFTWTLSLSETWQAAGVATISI
jgi:hypothetical protein